MVAVVLLLAATLALQLLLDSLVDSLGSLTQSDVGLLVGWMGDDANVIQADNALDVTNPHLFAVDGFVGALEGNTILGVLVVVLESERLAVDVAALDQLQRIVGVVGVGQVALVVHTVRTKCELQCVFLRVAESAQHVHYVAVVIQVVHHVAAVQQFLSDTAWLQHLKNDASRTPRGEVDASLSEDDGATLNHAALLAVLIFADLQTAKVVGYKSYLFHILVYFENVIYYSVVLSSGVYCVSDMPLTLFSHLLNLALQSVDFLFRWVGCHKPLFLSLKT